MTLRTYTTGTAIPGPTSATTGTNVLPTTYSVTQWPAWTPLRYTQPLAAPPERPGVPPIVGQLWPRRSG